jgi:hypothetical protein
MNNYVKFSLYSIAQINISYCTVKMDDLAYYKGCKQSGLFIYMDAVSLRNWQDV